MLYSCLRTKPVPVDFRHCEGGEDNIMKFNFMMELGKTELILEKLKTTDLNLLRTVDLDTRFLWHLTR